MATELYLPASLPYPITVTSLDARSPASISRGTRLLSYSFTVGVPPETRFGTWDSTVDGTVDLWRLKVGEVVTAQRAKQKPVIYVTEPCKHGVQIGGLCGLCGKDMTTVDYTGFSDASRASIQMTHSANGPTVSLEEAQRLERETAEHLLKTRRLSLIVDLDQTIVHATVDPTVGEWIAEGEAWEARQTQKTQKAAQASQNLNEDGGSVSEPEADDEANPNWEALKDVKKFRLAAETFAHQHRGPSKEKGKVRVEDEGCLYYIKPRPGWQEFLKHTASKYEMHVYTMGTRAYAEAVCAAIDPDRKLFGGRILTRDESGSLTQKSLQRLFPCDTSMVVIIDDRADVWEWSPNLIKVIPYDFFVGIGDINSTFLPKLDPISALPGPKGDPDSLKQAATVDSPSITASEVSEEAAEVAKDELIEQNTLILEAQLEERPLAKKQEELSEKGSINDDASEKKPANGAVVQKPPEPAEKSARKALLTNNDYELNRVKMLLDHVHQSFFNIYDAVAPQRSQQSSFKGKQPPLPYDVTQIIPRMRADVFNGCHIVFSSVIPLDTRPDTTEIWKTAHNFGATCHTEITSRTTHVVAAKRGTAKVDAARRRGGIKIVWLSWFTDSIALWRRQDERPYLLDEPPVPASTLPSSPTVDSSQMGSSDFEVDTDDWDDDDVEVDATAADTNNADTGADTGTGTGTPTGSVDGSTPIRTPLRPEELTNDVAWEDIDAEVEAAMNESDTEDGGSERGDESMVFAGDNITDEEMTDDAQSVNSDRSGASTSKRKRLRSLTPSETAELDGGDDDQLRSPLAKRKRLASQRSGISPLKQAISADELTKDLPGELSTIAEADGAPVGRESDDDDDSDDDDAAFDDDDFLAREFEEMS